MNINDNTTPYLITNRTNNIFRVNTKPYEYKTASEHVHIYLSCYIPTALREKKFERMKIFFPKKLVCKKISMFGGTEMYSKQNLRTARYNCKNHQ